jgi:hypothetical protein
MSSGICLKGAKAASMASALSPAAKYCSRTMVFAYSLVRLATSYSLTIYVAAYRRSCSDINYSDCKDR